METVDDGIDEVPKGGSYAGGGGYDELSLTATKQQMLLRTDPSRSLPSWGR
jgi:hypothetical protein